AASVLTRKEAVLPCADGVNALQPRDPAGWGVFLLGFRGDQEPDRGDEQDCGEDVGDECETFEQGDAAGDEEAAHEHGAGDTPEEHTRLADAVDAEETEE